MSVALFDGMESDLIAQTKAKKWAIVTSLIFQPEVATLVRYLESLLCKISII